MHRDDAQQACAGELVEGVVDRRKRYRDARRNRLFIQLLDGARLTICLSGLASVIQLVECDQPRYGGYIFFEEWK